MICRPSGAITNFQPYLHSGAGGTLGGGDGNDELIGHGAGQTFVGGAGNDVMKVETALSSLGDVTVFSGNRATFAITLPDIDTLQIAGPDGRDTLGQASKGWILPIPRSTFPMGRPGMP